MAGETCDCIKDTEHKSTKVMDNGRTGSGPLTLLLKSDPGYCTCSTKNKKTAATTKSEREEREERERDFKQTRRTILHPTKSMACSPGWPPAGIVAMLMIAHGFVTGL